MSVIKALIPAPTLTVVICKNHIKTIDDPCCDNPKKSSLPSTYVGDICPALQTGKSEYIKVQNGYYFNPNNEKEWKWLPFYANFELSKSPQILFIKPPIKESIDNNYLTNLISNYKSLNKLLFNNTDKNDSNYNNSLTKDIITLIFNYLPFQFPIFISCASLYRGRGSFTHWTYPYTKSKEWILKYLQKCENTFDDKEDCYYTSEWYLMSDDVPVDFTNKSDWIDDHKKILLNYQSDNKHERIWNESMLIAKKQSKKLHQVIHDRNDVGGSYWLSMRWKKNEKGVEWFSDDIQQFKQYAKVNVVYSRIGGSCGIKSRCYYQTLPHLQGKYLPMSVLSVCCNWKMFKSIVNA